MNDPATMPCYTSASDRSYSFKTPTKSSSTKRTSITPRCTPSPQHSRYKHYCRSADKRARLSTSGDRFIPSRRDLNYDLINSALLFKQKSEDATQTDVPTSSVGMKEYKRFLRSEVCGVPLERFNENGEIKSLLSFRSNQDDVTRTEQDAPRSHDILSGTTMIHSTPTGNTKICRCISSAPVRSLEIPNIVDDFYLNVLCWSQDNILAIALASAVYLYHFPTLAIHRLTTVRGHGNVVTSLSWRSIYGQSKYLAIGTLFNTIEVWDVQSLKKIRKMRCGQSGGACSLSWNSQWLSSGGRDGMILQHDIRIPAGIVAEYAGHNGLVCGLAWNADGTALASGSNDETVCIWDASISSRRRIRGNPYYQVTPRFVFKDHISSVKALAWCPFRERVLASGGGKDDRSIKVWNTQNGSLLHSVDTGSQVTSLAWSTLYPELVSSHGYLGNSLIVWKFPSLTKIQTLEAHGDRVLHMAMSPDGRLVASAGQDDVLHLWDMTGQANSNAKITRNALGLSDAFVLPSTPSVR